MKQNVHQLKTYLSAKEFISLFNRLMDATTEAETQEAIKRFKASKIELTNNQKLAGCGPYYKN